MFPLQRFQEVNKGWLFSGKAHDNETDRKTVYGRIALGIISQINSISRDLIPLSDSIFIWKLCKQLGRSQN